MRGIGGDKGGEEAMQDHSYEQVAESAELTRLKLDIEATREGRRQCMTTPMNRWWGARS